MSVFGEFANYYDLVHQSKDYEKESSYVDSLIRNYKPNARTILDIGCGTGNYAFAMQELGYVVTGVDASSQMIRIAKQKLAGKHKDKFWPSFYCEKMEEYKCQTKSDAVICLFFSLCYQSTENLIFQSLKRFKELLDDNGILVFDFWNKSGVLAQQPDLKIQRYQTENMEITKVVEPTIDTSSDCVGIDYTFYLENDKSEISKFKEFHKVRYLTPELLLKYLSKLNFKIERVEGWMTNQKLKRNEWSGVIVARLH